VQNVDNSKSVLNCLKMALKSILVKIVLIFFNKNSRMRYSYNF